jgi:hypothetical protein
MATTFNVELTLLEDLLGTACANPDIYKEFIESKRPSGTGLEQGGEAADLPQFDPDDELARETTVFRRLDGKRPYIMDYQIKGFFKDACGLLARADDTLSKDLKAYKKEINGLIFPDPRKIPLIMPEGATMGINQRPLRGQTAKGERIALMRSETVPPATIIRFQLVVLAERLEDLIHEWLDYGRHYGLGQWRNGGWGRFAYAMERAK